MIGTGSLTLIIGLIVAGLALLVVLYRVEDRAADPIVPNRLFKNPQLVTDFILFVVLWGAFIAFNIYIPMWAQGLLGLSALLGGMTQIPGAVTNLIGSLAGPAVQPRLGKHRVVTLGTVAFLIAFSGMLMMGDRAPFLVFIIDGRF